MPILPAAHSATTVEFLRLQKGLEHLGARTETFVLRSDDRQSHDLLPRKTKLKTLCVVQCISNELGDEAHCKTEWNIARRIAPMLESLPYLETVELKTSNYSPLEISAAAEMLSHTSRLKRIRAEFGFVRSSYQESFKPLAIAIEKNPQLEALHFTDIPPADSVEELRTAILSLSSLQEFHDYFDLCPYFCTPEFLTNLLSVDRGLKRLLIRGSSYRFSSKTIESIAVALSNAFCRLQDLNLLCIA